MNDEDQVEYVKVQTSMSNTYHISKQELADLVAEQKLVEASNINDSGLETQLNYLEGALGTTRFIQEMREAEERYHESQRSDSDIDS